MTDSNVLPFRISAEWQSGEGVAAEELRATWARLEIWIGDTCVSQVEDARSGSTRNSIFVSTYPLAEWIAYNWWFLKAHSRPAALPTSSWSAKVRPRHAYSGSWLGHHNLRTIGEGMPSPNIAIVPEGSYTKIVWWADDPSRTYPVRFLNSGDALLERDHVTAGLAEIVEYTIARLTHMDIDDTPLSKEWAAIQATDAEEEDFCLAAASLGLDPYSEASSVADVIENSYESLGRDLFEDFVNAADPARLDDGLSWVETTSKAIEEHDESGREPIDSFGDVGQDVQQRFHAPWMQGYELARQFRRELGLDSISRFEPARFVTFEESSSGDRGLEGLGGVSGRGEGVVYSGSPKPPRGRRFLASRAIWRLIAGGDQSRFLLTPARLDQQKAERAFAAELLAPATGIAERLEVNPGLVTETEIESLAEHFDVSEYVISHQIENHLLS